MKLYDRYAKCPKCNSPHIGTKYVSFGYIGMGDALRRTCGNCHYVWDEQPLDDARATRRSLPSALPRETSETPETSSGVAGDD